MPDCRLTSALLRRAGHQDARRFRLGSQEGDAHIDRG